MTMAANVKSGPMGHVHGYAWNLRGIEDALGRLLSDAANGPGLGPNQLGDVRYEFVSAAGFTAILLVKNTAQSIAADACDMAQVAFNALTRSSPSFERVLVETANGLAKFAVYKTGQAVQGDAKRDVVLEELWFIEDARALEDRSPASPELAKRNGPYNRPKCNNLKKRTGAPSNPIVAEREAGEPLTFAPDKRAGVAISQLGGNTRLNGCSSTDYTCEVVILTKNGKTNCVKCKGGKQYFVQTYNNQGHCGGAFFKSGDCTGNPIQGYKESVHGKCKDLDYNSYFLECVGA